MKDQIPQLEPTAEGFRVRLRYGAGQQGRFTVRVRDEVEAGRRAQLLRTLAADLVKSGRRPIEAKVILQTLGEATGADEFSALLAVAGASAKKQRAPGSAQLTTFAQVAQEWTSGRLHTAFPDHVKAKRTSSLDEQRCAVLSETIGQIPISGLTLEHADLAMSKLPPGLSASTRRQYGQALSRVLKLAVYPLRLLKATPLPPGWLPRNSAGKAKAWLYPDEEASLLACRDVPKERRILYGFLAREGMRISEALGLTWADLDLKHGMVRLDANKTDSPRAWALDPAVVRALHQFKTNDAKGREHVFLPPPGEKYAEVFRDDLKRAQVTRPELFTSTARRMAIRIHDLRGTFVTHSLANGKTEGWVQDRTGHTSSQMINLYRRQARTAAEVGMGGLASMHLAFPEFWGPHLPTQETQGESEGESEFMEEQRAGAWKQVILSGSSRDRTEDRRIKSGTQGNASDPEAVNSATCDTDGSGKEHADSPLTHPGESDEAAFMVALRVLGDADDAEGIRLLLEERKLRRESRAGNIVTLRPKREPGSS